VEDILPYLAGIGCSLCYGAATVLEQVAARRQKPIGSLHPSHLIRLAQQTPYILGVALDLVGWILFLLAARKLPLFLALSFVAASLVVTAILAHVYLAARVSSREHLAIVGVMVGLVLLGVAAQSSGGHSMNHYFRVALECAPVLIGLAGLMLLKMPQRKYSTFGLAALAGLAFGGTGLVARIIHFKYLTVHFVLLVAALVLYGALGTLFMAAALQKDTVNKVNGVLFSSELVIPSIIGILFLGDRARKGWWPVLVLGFICVAVSVMVIALDTKAARASKSTHRKV
jgi:hypothetical protein